MDKDIKLNEIQLNIDKLYINRAFQLAYLGIFTSSPNPSVGCIIVKKKKIIGEGVHIISGGPHAEINALREAGEKANKSTIYITLEPCSHYGNTPPCIKSIIKSGIKRVVIASKDPNKKNLNNSFKIFKKFGINYFLIKNYLNIKSNKGFFKRIITGLPYTKLKFGISIDGSTGLLSGVSKWITSVKSRLDVQKLRFKNQVILSTSKTILFDNPSFNIRINEINPIIKNLYPFKNIKQPLLIIIDSKNIINPKYKVIKKNREIFLIRLKKDNKIWPKYVHQIIFKKSKFKINLKSLFFYLGKIKINNILIESGAIFSGCLLKLNLINEIILYVSPKILGNKSLSLFNLPIFKKIFNKNLFYFKNIKKIGSDLKIKLIKNKNLFNYKKFK